MTTVNQEPVNEPEETQVTDAVPPPSNQEADAYDWATVPNATHCPWTRSAAVPNDATEWFPSHTHHSHTLQGAETWCWTTPAGSWKVETGRLMSRWINLTGPGGEWRFRDSWCQLYATLVALGAIGPVADVGSHVSRGEYQEPASNIPPPILSKSGLVTALDSVRDGVTKDTEIARLNGEIRDICETVLPEAHAEIRRLTAALQVCEQVLHRHKPMAYERHAGQQAAGAYLTEWSPDDVFDDLPDFQYPAAKES